MTFAYSTFTDKSPDFFSGYLDTHSVPQKHYTRSQNNANNNNNYIYNMPRLQKTLTSVRFASMALWNKLPDSIKKSVSMGIFKSRTKQWLLEGYTNQADINNDNLD